VKNWDGTVLEPGTGAYTCYPTRDSMKKRGKMSMCLDKIWQAWADAWQNKKPFKANEVGIAYMLAGDVGSSNTDPYADAPTSNNQWVEPGPHLMVVVPDPAALQAYPLTLQRWPLRDVEGHTLCSHHGARRQASRGQTLSCFEVYQQLCNGSEAPDKHSGQLTGNSDVTRLGKGCRQIARNRTQRFGITDWNRDQSF